uniref:Uncharacterized protein n=1 Tax=Rhizophora mucronata TaxID=61149 RepID=A0A2P2JSB2_RHIMU
MHRQKVQFFSVIFHFKVVAIEGICQLCITCIVILLKKV